MAWVTEPTPEFIAPGRYRCRRCNHEWTREDDQARPVDERRDCPVCDVTRDAVEVAWDRDAEPMSVCSQHQKHEPGCRLCETPSPVTPCTLTARLRAGLAKLMRSEIQPGVITDRGGTRFFGITWRRKL